MRAFPLGLGPRISRIPRLSCIFSRCIDHTEFEQKEIRIDSTSFHPERRGQPVGKFDGLVLDRLFSPISHLEYHTLYGILFENFEIETPESSNNESFS